MYFVCSYCFTVYKQPDRTVSCSGYDQIGCVVFWQSQKVWYFHYLTRRQADNFGILSAPNGGPTLSHSSAPRGEGVAWIVLSLKTVGEHTAYWLNQSLKESTFWLAQKKEIKPPPCCHLWRARLSLRAAVSEEESAREVSDGEPRGYKSGSDAICHTHFLSTKLSRKVAPARPWSLSRKLVSHVKPCSIV